MLDFLRRWPGTHAGAEWKMFLAGGAVAAVAPASTAFVHRKALMLSTIDLSWTEVDDVASPMARRQIISAPITARTWNV